MENEESTPEFDPFASEKAKPKRGGLLLAFLALLLALAVAGWNAWQWWLDRDAVDTSAALQSDLQQVSAGQAQLAQAQREQARRLEAVERLELDDGLAELDQALDRAQSVAGSDRARLAALESSLADTVERLEGLESRVGALVVRGESPRQGLGLSEVDYLLRSANERLQLYGDMRTADRALDLADQQLEAMDDPVYLPVRRAIAAARSSLDEVQRPDAIALTETLGRLQARIPVLPFPGQEAPAVADDPAPGEEEPGVWARFKAAMSGLVSVRRREADGSLISLEDKDYVRQGLWLQLEAARLALLRENDQAFASAVERADATLQQYFDREAATVQRFDEALQELAGTSLAVAWPDISTPWTRLHQIRSVREAPPQAAAEAGTPDDPVVAPSPDGEPPADGPDDASADSAGADPDETPGEEPPVDPAVDDDTA